jgi:type III secretory pathway component EscR
MTYEFLRKSDNDLKKRCQVSQAKAQAQIVEQICKTMSALTGSTISEEHKQTLSTLVEHAVALSQVLGSQRATYRCFLPQATDKDAIEFESTTMENLMDDQESDGITMDVRCIVSPALIKQGGERGEDVRDPYCVTVLP